MTGISHQWQLMALALALYLSDCCLLLYVNEGVLISAGGNRWRALFGGGLTIAGRALQLLNPLTPHRPAFRLAWNQEAALTDRGDRAWSELPLSLRGIAPFVFAAGVGLFILLPVGMFTEAGAVAVIAAVILLYGGILLALLLLYRRRAKLPLRGKSFAGFAFECVACPPFGVNLLRRLALRMPVTEILPLAAHRLLAPADWQRLREQCVGSLQGLARLAAEDPALQQLLLQRQQELPK